MSATRRGFLGLLAAVPFVGTLFPAAAAPSSVLIAQTEALWQVKWRDDLHGFVARAWMDEQGYDE